MSLWLGPSLREALVAAAKHAAVAQAGALTGSSIAGIAAPSTLARWPRQCRPVNAPCALVLRRSRHAGPATHRLHAGIVGKTLCPEARLDLMDFEGQFDQEVQVGRTAGAPWPRGLLARAFHGHTQPPIGAPRRPTPLCRPTCVALPCRLSMRGGP